MRVLLREPERCPECNRIFLSLYGLRGCNDHDDEIGEKHQTRVDTVKLN